MPNPAGKNGYGRKVYPADDVLRASLKEYVLCNLSQAEKLARLQDDHGLSIGPFPEVAADGHEKIASQALKMGGVGISIYGWKDKWTSTILMLSVVPDCRSAGAIGHLYLDLVEHLEGIPLQVTVDKGSETGWQYALHQALRDMFASEVDQRIYPPLVVLKSVHNTVIEGFWHWLREKMGFSLREHLLRGKSEHRFSPSSVLHHHLFNWIFPSLVQSALDDFCFWWNHHQIRQQPEKDMPSGHTPIDALKHPKLLGGLDCRIPVPSEVITELRALLTEQVGSRETHMTWVSDDFVAHANDTHRELNLPIITFENSWDIFTRMADAMEDL
ncbi:hypothetical protein EYR38_005409 [Pleurotus pulmonarius]|nr:hypothetical protein EYR38_005409 [Pleurotus pulmonarius]